MNVTQAEVQAWLETTKLDLAESPNSLDEEMEESVSTAVIAKIAGRYDTTTWVDANTTPKLVRKIIAMKLAAWIYDKEYAVNDPDGAGYADRLRGMAKNLIDGILTASIDLLDVEEDPAPAGAVSPSFYPNDAAETADATQAAKFTVGMVF